MMVYPWLFIMQHIWLIWKHLYTPCTTFTSEISATKPPVELCQCFCYLHLLFLIITWYNRHLRTRRQLRWSPSHTISCIIFQTLIFCIVIRICVIDFLLYIDNIHIYSQQFCMRARPQILPWKNKFINYILSIYIIYICYKRNSNSIPHQPMYLSFLRSGILSKSFSSRGILWLDMTTD